MSRGTFSPYPAAFLGATVSQQMISEETHMAKTVDADCPDLIHTAPIFTLVLHSKLCNRRLTFTIEVRDKGAPYQRFVAPGRNVTAGFANA